MAAQLTASYPPSITTDGREIRATGQLVQLTGTFGMGALPQPTILAREIRLRNADGAATVPPLGSLVALGIRDAGGACTYRPLEPPIQVISGGVRTQLTRPDGSGFSLDLFPDRQATLMTLRSNPSSLCLAFDVPAGPVPRLALELAGRWFQIPGPQTPAAPAQAAPAAAAPAPAALAPKPSPTAGAAPAAPAPMAEDARGGELVCRRGNETLQLQVPSGRLAQVREIAARMGFTASDCTFRGAP